MLWLATQTKAQDNVVIAVQMEQFITLMVKHKILISSGGG